MSDKLTACKDCKHYHSTLVQDGIPFNQVCLGHRRFNAYHGEWNEPLGTIEVCYEINTRGHCDHFKAKP